MVASIIKTKWRKEKFFFQTKSTLLTKLYNMQLRTLISFTIDRGRTKLHFTPIQMAAAAIYKQNERAQTIDFLHY